jgi:hypothetical protein
MRQCELRENNAKQLFLTVYPAPWGEPFEGITQFPRVNRANRAISARAGTLHLLLMGRRC